jgi:beta-mannosidase
MDLETWIYITQLMQSECLAYAYRCWRRQWKGPGREYIGGALVWQLNDCWPVISWATCDFYLNRKLAWYAIKRESAPIGVGIYRSTPQDKAKKTLDPEVPGPPPDLVDKTYTFDVWGSNLSLEPRKLTLSLRMFDAISGKLYQEHDSKEVTLGANMSTEISEDLKVDQSLVVQARLIDSNGSVVARASDWPQPLKHIVFGPRSVKVKAFDGYVEVSADAPIKGVELTSPDPVDLEDNGFDVFPNDVYIVQAPGVKSSSEIRVRFYEQEAIESKKNGRHCDLM